MCAPCKKTSPGGARRGDGTRVVHKTEAGSWVLGACARATNPRKQHNETHNRIFAIDTALPFSPPPSSSPSPPLSFPSLLSPLRRALGRCPRLCESLGVLAGGRLFGEHPGLLLGQTRRNRLCHHTQIQITNIRAQSLTHKYSAASDDIVSSIDSLNDNGIDLLSQLHPPLPSISSDGIEDAPLSRRGLPCVSS